MKIKDVVSLFETSHEIDDETIDHAMWWVQRWVSGSMDDADWAEGESVNKLTVDEAFSVIQQVIGNSVYSGTMLYRYLSVDEAEVARMSREKTILPNKHIFQSFTPSLDTAYKIAEEFGDIGGKGKAVIVGCQPLPANIMFGMQALFSSRKLKHWTMALSDWEWQDEVLVRVTRPLPIREIVSVYK